MPTTLSRVRGTAKLDLKGRGLHGLPALNNDVRSWSLGPAHLLVTCESDQRKSTLKQVLTLPEVWVTDVSSLYAHFLISGANSRDVLRKLTSLNVSDRALPDLACGQSRLAHVHAIVLRRDIQQAPAFHLLVSREYGESVWDALLHAGREYDLETLAAE